MSSSGVENNWDLVKYWTINLNPTIAGGASHGKNSPRGSRISGYVQLKRFSRDTLCKLTDSGGFGRYPAIRSRNEAPLKPSYHHRRRPPFPTTASAAALRQDVQALRKSVPHGVPRGDCTAHVAPYGRRLFVVGVTWPALSRLAQMALARQLRRVPPEALMSTSRPPIRAHFTGPHIEHNPMWGPYWTAPDRPRVPTPVVRRFRWWGPRNLDTEHRKTLHSFRL
ncbi:hypothetical protein H6P81_012025 [Aristolochia fimbriata]|uniref:Uncharacterized protein n=1 Tax=Aristolochia fimbriata TaxID=158543 RepID=A0AAV7EAK8_ARIFI|nr:hypothetical protein H6P81_012025 [Aristolochia fimbriata]